MLTISQRVTIPDNEIRLQFIRAQGPGGQHVNKSSTAVELRFDIIGSPSLPEYYKSRLMALKDRRISKQGVVRIKAQRFRSQEQNREDALLRLQLLLQSVSQAPKVRRPTRPTRGSQQRRVDSKTQRGQLKKERRSPGAY